MENLFKNLNLSTNVIDAIDHLGYTQPSKIQELLIPVILSGTDTFGQAQTGTGKTLAFAASILTNIKKDKTGVKALVLCPTRELALQIAAEISTLDNNREFNIISVYGGSDIKRQINMLRNNPDIVIGTPGRVKDLLKRKKLNLTKLDYFVLDEADEMLNMGFIKDIKEIFSKTSRDRQVIMLSATMAKDIKELISSYLRSDYKHIKVESTSKTADLINQNYYVVNSKQKNEVLYRIIDVRTLEKVLIFCKTKNDCDELTEKLQEKGYNADLIHGDVTQGLRIKTLARYKNGEFNILVATDVAARGIHVDNIDLVVNYHLPFDKESYIHRIGRTGRANGKGEATSLVTHKEGEFMKRLEKYTNAKIEEKSIPTKEEIVNAKYEEVIKKAEGLKDEDLSKELTYVRDLNKADLINFAAALLKHNINSGIKADLTKDISVKERSVRTIADDKTRLFLNIGKKDGLRKSSLLELLVTKANIIEDSVSNIEILENFTFIDVNKTDGETIVNTLPGNNFNEREINVEFSNKKSTKGNRGNFNRNNSRGNSSDRNRGRNGDRDRRSSGRSDNRRRDNNREDRKRN